MKASVGVKRLLMYALILLCILFIGFLAYFFARNDEQITFTVEEGTVLYLNVGEEDLKLPILHEEPHADTTITVSVSDSEILLYSEATLTFKAIKGGMASVTITPSNKDFGPYRFDVMVGEGSVSNPWYVSSALQLAKIGGSGENAWELTDSYEMINDINLANYYTTENPYFTPIGTRANSFAGNFNGNGFTIDNLKINTELSEVGFFGAVSAYGNVEGIKFDNLEIVSNGSYSSVGSVAGVNFGTVSRVIVNGKINSTQASSVGGIVGTNDYSVASATVASASATIDFSGAFDYVGGVVGANNAGIIFNTKADININATSLTGYFGGIVGRNIANTLGQYSYTRPVVKNSYAIIDSTNVVGNCGVIVGNNTEKSNPYFEVNKYVSNYGYSSSITVACADGKTPIESEMKIVAKDELQSDTLFAGWDFENAWQMVVYPEINIENPAGYHGEYIPGSAYTNEAEVKNAMKAMINNPNANTTFTINTGNTIEIDCYELKNNTLWTPVGTDEAPFNNKLIVEEGTTLIFKNIKFADSSQEVGFFGTMQDGLVKNVTFKDIKANGKENGKIAGGIVCRMINSTLEKCIVDGASLTNYETAGLIAGTLNNCTVKDCKVALTNVDLENLLDNSYANVLYYGGVAGTSYNSNISNCSVDMANIKSTVDGVVYAGGIIGNAVHTSVSYCTNLGLNIVSQQSNGYYGGLIGATTGKTVIEKSYNLGKIEASASGSSQAGGLVGNNASEAVVKTSFSKTPKVQAKNVGGLVAYNSGTITECYSDGEYIGYDIGGLASINAGTIYNCYTLASIVGIGNKNNAAAGLVAFLPESGNVKLCFSTATISGDDCKCFAETSARIRYTGFENFFDNLLGGYAPGSLTDCVVINYGSATVQNKLIFGSQKSWVECTDDDCRGLTANNPFEIAGFTTKAINIWTYPIGEYPTLTNCITEPVA